MEPSDRQAHRRPALPGRVLAMTGLFAACLTACAMPLQTRTGAVLAPGEGQLGGQIGGSFGPSKLPDAIPPELMANWALTGRLGVAPRFELLADLGWLRQAGALRLDLLNARRWGFVSAALIAWGGGQVVSERDPSSPAGEATRWAWAPELGGGLDLSIPLWGWLEHLMNLTVSHGAQWFHVPREEEPVHIEQSHYQMLSREETRLACTLGVAITATPERVPLQIVIGVSPYWIVGSPGVPGDGDGRPDGVTFTIGVGAVGRLWGR